MKKYIEIGLVTADMGQIKDFYNNLNKTIDDIQKKELEVEVQYSFSNEMLTTLILGYKI